MKDPVDLLGVHPSGAAAKRPDPRDFPFVPHEIAQAAEPFDWNMGYDVERDLDFTLPTKNQGSSGSCGGQSFSYYGQVLQKAYGSDSLERSAKYHYSQVYAPGGGSADRDLANISIKQGFGLENATPSYKPTTNHGIVIGTQAPDETFMERPQDITAAARISAAKNKISLAYSFPTTDIDTVARALATGKGIVLGITGENNGTWLTAFPKPIGSGNVSGAWRHYMYGGKARIENNQKGIWAKQSWGPNVGDNGWQFISEDHFKAGAIWAAVVLVYNPRPSAPPSHQFNSEIKLGQSGPDVTALQELLAYDGEFNVAPTGYYGQVTAGAVLKFQIKYNVASLATLEQLGGDVVGPATRAALNKLTK